MFSRIAKVAACALALSPLTGFAQETDRTWYLNVSLNSFGLDDTSTEESRVVESCSLGVTGCSSSTETTKYDTSFDSDNTLSLIGGYYAETVRVELEYTQVDSDLDTNSASEETLELNLLMVNVWKDFDLYGFKPYAGGSFGLGFAEQGDTDDEFVLARLGFGLNFDLIDRARLDIGYRLMYAEPDMVMEGSNREIVRDLRGGSFVIGLGYAF